MKPITYNEALKKRTVFAEEMQEKLRQESEAAKNNMIKEMNDFILGNFETLNQKPMHFNYCTKNIHNVYKEIQSLYTDFTVIICPENFVVSIKLADKDWDWQGYGIKPTEPACNRRRKKSIFYNAFDL